MLQTPSRSDKRWKPSGFSKTETIQSYDSPRRPIHKRSIDSADEYEEIESISTSDHPLAESTSEISEVY